MYRPEKQYTAPWRRAALAWSGLLLLALAGLLAACSEVGESERYIYVAPVEVGRAVLVEDFTGQRCINCPKATEEIEKLQQQYGAENVIAVGIHSGPFAHRTTISSPRLPLGTALGDDYFSHWGIEAQPGLRVNRTGAIVYDPSQIPVRVSEQLARQSPVRLQLQTKFQPDSRQLEVVVQGITSQNLDARLQVWLTEDDIVSAQYMPDGSSNPDYVHKHVFRSSLTTDDYGDPFPLNEGTYAQLGYHQVLDEGWEVEHLNVVAFVYNDVEGVVQAVTGRVTVGDEQE